MLALWVRLVRVRFGIMVRFRVRVRSKIRFERNSFLQFSKMHEQPSLLTPEQVLLPLLGLRLPSGCYIVCG